MKSPESITAERVRELLKYDPESGIFTRLKTSSWNAKAGDELRSRDSSGYINTLIDGRFYTAHRLAFLWMEGALPVSQVDHRDGDRRNNRWPNLRQCTHGENCQNTAVYSTNRSGLIGVGFHKATQRWRARIDVGNKQKHLGLFDTKEQAYAAYLAAKAEYHKFNPTVRHAA